MKYAEGLGASLVWDGGTVVSVPEEMGTPRDDQMTGTVGERVSEVALRLCYDSMGSGRKTEDTISNILSTKHYSVFEHYNRVLEITFDLHATSIDFLKISTILANRKGVFWVWDAFDYTGEGLDRGAKLRICCNIRAVIEWDAVTERLPGEFHGLAAPLGSVLIDAWHDDVPLLVTLPQKDVRHCMGKLKIEDAEFVDPKYAHEKWISLYMKGSRGWSHEQVRHRFAVSQRSTRYCDESNSPWILHPLIQKLAKADPDGVAAAVSTKKDPLSGDNVIALLAGITNMVEGARIGYEAVSKVLSRWLSSQGVDKKTARKQARGAARGLLGNALQTEMIFSAPAVFWLHILDMRCADMSDAEIRLLHNIALPVLKGCRYGELFEHLELVPTSDGIGMCLKGGGHS